MTRVVPWLTRLREAANLWVSLLPGALFGLGLLSLRGEPRFTWLAEPPRYPWELWVVALAGTTATLAGMADWRYHRTAGIRVGPQEHRAELRALRAENCRYFS